MFKFLKEKLKSAVESFSKKIEEQPEEKTLEQPQEKGFFERLKDRFVKPEVKPAEEVDKPVQAAPPPQKPQIKEEPQPISEKPAEPEQIQPTAAEKILKEASMKEQAKPVPAAEKILEPVSQPEKIVEPAIKPEKILEPSVKPQKTQPKQQIQEESAEQQPRPEPEKSAEKGFFEKIADSITTRAISEDKFNDIFWDLEVALLENNVALEVVDKIRNDLKQEILNKKVRIGKTQEVITESLSRSIDGLFAVEGIDMLEQAKGKKPYVIVFVGVNGSGKTTTIAKMAHMMLKNKLSCVIAAADTFRAAAIQQLEEHANRLDVKLIKHDYGSDPAAVAFDAVKYAQARNIDVVLIDTAGRLHSNTNLMDEMKKIIRVAKPDMKIFIGEAITGNDCVEQAKQFNEAVGIDAIILAKADVDEKGGAAVSVSYVTHKPIIYLGTGQDYDSLVEFSPKMITDNLGLGA